MRITIIFFVATQRKERLVSYLMTYECLLINDDRKKRSKKTYIYYLKVLT